MSIHNWAVQYTCSMLRIGHILADIRSDPSLRNSFSVNIFKLFDLLINSNFTNLHTKKTTGHGVMDHAELKRIVRRAVYEFGDRRPRMLGEEKLKKIEELRKKNDEG